MRTSIFTTLFLTILFFAGCACVKEGLRGVAGTSTKVLEDGRADALRKEFDLDERSCFAEVQYVLAHGRTCVYAKDFEKKLIAVYVSEEDTTPVGVFVEQLSVGRSQVLVSSPSSYAKELVAAAVFAGIERSLKEKNVKVQLDAIEPGTGK